MEKKNPIITDSTISNSSDMIHSASVGDTKQALSDLYFIETKRRAGSLLYAVRAALSNNHLKTAIALIRQEFDKEKRGAIVDDAIYFSMGKKEINDTRSELVRTEHVLKFSNYKKADKLGKYKAPPTHE